MQASSFNTKPPPSAPPQAPPRQGSRGGGGGGSPGPHYKPSPRKIKIATTTSSSSSATAARALPGQPAGLQVGGVSLSLCYFSLTVHYPLQQQHFLRGAAQAHSTTLDVKTLLRDIEVPDLLLLLLL